MEDGIISNGGTASHLQVKLTLWSLSTWAGGRQHLQWRDSLPTSGRAYSMTSVPELEDGIISNGGKASQFQMAQEWATLGQNTQDVRRHTFHV